MLNFANKAGLSLILAVATITFAGSVAQAQVINGGFETGNFSGWTVNTGAAGTADVVSGYTNFYNGSFYTPVEGNYFAVLGAGAGTDVYTTISQTFTASAGQTITGNAFFDGGDYLPNNDDAYVDIVENGQSLFSSNIATVGDYGSTPWTPFSYTFTTGGTYTIQGGVENVLDNTSPSQLGLDGISLSAAPAPEMSSALSTGLLAVLVALCAIGSRRRSHIAKS